MHEINTKCLEAVTSNPALYVQCKGAHVQDYAQLMVTLNLHTAGDEAWFRAAFLSKFEENKIHPDHEPSMHSAVWEAESEDEIRFSLCGRKDPRHRHGREYVEVTIPMSVRFSCLVST